MKTTLSTKMKKHPAAIARDKFLEKNDRVLEISILKSPEMKQFLQNRIEEAFIAGWDAGVEHERRTSGGIAE